jgi:hypothetical protein
MIIGGWGGGTQLPAVLKGLDAVLPRAIIFSCLNPGQGWDPQDELLAEIGHNREVWAIPWLEGDAKLWHMQPRVALLRDQVLLARKQHLDGLLAIHWRTREIRLNLESFARFASDPDSMPSVDQIYQEDCILRYGSRAGEKIAPVLSRMDREHWLDPAESPEYYPYEPGWGRLPSDLARKLTDLKLRCKTLQDPTIKTEQKENLDWLINQIDFTLLLDQTGRCLEPAYRLKEKWLAGHANPNLVPEDVRRAMSELNQAPLAELFNTFRGRNLSRGELGVLSSVNQKLWLQYRELEEFIKNIPPDK